ncbi:unnamed protein product [Paramecium primaurelia]|uniref:Uncharacterized protein n=1 Tax=Paramecium primaurelia TaxID=5886 RepID=A0A8S1K185_PARPR|nr:unnamed protein product [Paramecium primaurelia]
MNSRKSSTSTLDSEKTSPRLQNIRLKPIKFIGSDFMNNLFKKPKEQEIVPIEVNSDSDSSGSEHDVFDNDEILLKGIHLGDYDKLSPTDQLQMLYKIRFETYPKRREYISEQELANETQKLVNKIKLHFYKFKKILPLQNLPDFTKIYDINQDQNYDQFWDYYRNRNNHRKHKQIICHQKKKSEPSNPVLRSNSRIRTDCRIRTLAHKR